MLSVAPADVTALIANQTYGSSQQTNTAHSIASDNAGDFVVTWTRQDSIVDANGNPITDPSTGLPETVSDVWARYFTQNVQQITLPAGTAKFSLTDNDQTIDEISVTTGTAPAGATGTGGIEETGGSEVGYTSNPIEGTFNLFYNATGDDTIGQQDTAALPAIQYLAGSPALPLTFANSVTGSAVNQKLTFSTTQNAPVNGDINLQVGTTALLPIYFDNASLTTLGTTASDMETALQDFGYNATVTLDPSSTTASAVFDVTYTATQSDVLSVDYDSTDSALAATQIQSWLNGFAPVTGVSDATHAVVNAIDPNDLVVDFGAATQGLNQSTLLQYTSTEAEPSSSQTLTFASTAGYRYTPYNPQNTPNIPGFYTFSPVTGTIELQVGTVTTGPIAFNVTPDTTTTPNLATSVANTATAMQTALNAALAAQGVTATVTGTAVITTPNGADIPNPADTPPYGPAAPGVPSLTATFSVTFSSPEPAVQYVPVASPTSLTPGVPANFTNSADSTTLCANDGYHHDGIGDFAGGNDFNGLFAVGADHHAGPAVHSQQHSCLVKQRLAYRAGHFELLCAGADDGHAGGRAVRFSTAPNRGQRVKSVPIH